MTKAAIQERTERFFYIRPMPHRHTTSSALSPTVRAEFPSTTTTSSKIGSTNSSLPKPADFFKRGIENLRELWEAVVNNGGEYIID
jgi:hypothetical protein